MMLICLFCQLTHRQVWSRQWQWWWQQWQQEMVPNFHIVTWHGEVFHGLGVQDVESLILFDSLFLLDQGRREKERKKKKKKITMGEGAGFPQGWTHLAGCAAGRRC
jgi:hypothetical protein